MRHSTVIRPARVLVADGDPETIEMVSVQLRADGHVIERATDGMAAWQMLQRGRIDLAVLTVNMPLLDGLSLLHRLRSVGDHTPVLLLSDRFEELDMVLALEIGGDDYITKPFSARELGARARNVLRRSRRDLASAPIELGDVCIDLNARTVRRGSTLVHLTPLEFDLLVCLANAPGHAVGRGEILRQVWGSDRAGQHTLTEHVRRLRAKLGRSLIRTVSGYGYRLDADPPD